MPDAQPRRLPRRSRTIIYRNTSRAIFLLNSFFLQATSQTFTHLFKKGAKEGKEKAVERKIIGPPGRHEFRIRKKVADQKKKITMDFSRPAGVSIPTHVTETWSTHTPNFHSSSCFYRCSAAFHPSPLCITSMGV